MRLSEGIIKFIEHLRFEKRRSAHTTANYQRQLLQFLQFFQESFDSDPELKSVSHHHIRSWLAAIKEARPGVKVSTLKLKAAALSSLFHFAHVQGLVKKNPVRQLHSMPLPKLLPVAVEVAQAEALTAHQAFDQGFRGFTDRLICDLLYSTGIRRQELIQIRETDIAWGQKMIRVLGKGNKERYLPVSAALLDDLRDYIAAKKKELEQPNREFLLVLRSGKQLYPGYVYRVVHARLQELTTQEKCSPHVLRHSFATHLLNNGANIQAIRELLGHSSLAATQIYAHSDVSMLKKIHAKKHPRG